jgi:hypothetical protein
MIWLFAACASEDEKPEVDRCVWFADRDGDGFGQSEVFHVGHCSEGVPDGFTEQQGDCADGNASIHPGAPSLSTASIATATASSTTAQRAGPPSGRIATATASRGG